MHIVRSLGLLLNAIFPFLMPLALWLKGNSLRGFVKFFENIHVYAREERTANSGFAFKWSSIYPCLVDRYEEAGSIPRHYFWQDLWAARKVHAAKVLKHYDIGSRLDGFIAHCLPFCEVVMLDIRVLPVEIKNLSFLQANCMDMSSIADNSIDSLSSLHAIEHFGLGRYGDPIDPLGYKKAIGEIQRVVAQGKDIYFSVPIGIERLEFNAHRIFNPKTIIDLFSQCDLIEFSVVDDENMFHEDMDPMGYVSLNYGCGLFHFRKRQTS